jgi:hypothetical protein
MLAVWTDAFNDFSQPVQFDAEVVSSDKVWPSSKSV